MGPHNAVSLRQIYEEVEAAMKDLAEAIKILEGLPEDQDDTIRVLGSRGMYGTDRYPGAVPKLEQFAGDAKKKATLLAREIRRRRRG